MSHSPERMSSYRRHFEDRCSSSYQVRLASPSPSRRDVRQASVGLSRYAGANDMRVETMGRRSISAGRRSHMAGASARVGTLVCVGFDGQPAIDLDVASAENQEYLSTRTNERKEMIVLNDRLATYIDKVRSLEKQNKVLETEIEAYQSRFEKPTGVRLLYEEQLKELQKIANQMRLQRDMALATKESTAAQLDSIKVKYEEALELRKKAEMEIELFRPDVDKATSSRIALEKQLEQLEVEIEFLKRVHQQEIDELMKQMHASDVSAESGFAMPDLATALKQIQAQYDDIAAKNLQEMDSWYKTKFEDITSKTSGHVDKVRSIREEIAHAKKDIQTKEQDLDCLRTKNDALEAKIRETQEKNKKELEDLQAKIEALQLQLKSTKEKIALYLREYQDLLNVKMALELEITTYRKLIEGEDLRLSSMVQTLCLTSSSMSVGGAGMNISMGGASLGAGGISGRMGSAGYMGTQRFGAGGVGGGSGASAGGDDVVGVGSIAGSGAGFNGINGMGGGKGGNGMAASAAGDAGIRSAEGRAGDSTGGVSSGAGRMGADGMKGGAGSVGAGEGHGYDAIPETHEGQAVELTERRTVLIRTVKNEDNVLQTDHQEQTYTITGAADDSDDETV